MFALPRSSWADYDDKLISKGGGVHSRTAKKVPLTPQVREALGIAGGVNSMTPHELIHAILCAPVYAIASPFVPAGHGFEARDLGSLVPTQGRIASRPSSCSRFSRRSSSGWRGGSVSGSFGL